MVTGGIPSKKVSDAGLGGFMLIYAPLDMPEQKVEQAIEVPVI